MSIKSKVFTAVAALTLAGGAAGAGVMTAGPASAATPSCGDSCWNLFVQTFGTHRNPRFVLDSYKQRQTVGNPVILFRTSDVDPAEDWVVSAQGSVNDFFKAGLVSSAVNLHYGGGATIGGHTTPNDQAFEIEYAPYGAETGLCMGVATTPANNTPVTLQQCGMSAKTVWIVDSADVITKGHFVPLINGADTNFSHPYVLTYPQDGYPTDMPRPGLLTHTLIGYPNGTIADRQEWSANIGVLR